MLVVTHPTAGGPSPRFPSLVHHQETVWRMIQAQTKHPMRKMVNGMYSEKWRKSSGIEKGGSIYWNDIFFLDKLVISDITISCLMLIFGAKHCSGTLSLFWIGESKVYCFASVYHGMALNKSFDF